MLGIKKLNPALALALAGAVVWGISLPSEVRGEKWKFIFFSDSQDPAWGQWMNTNILSELAVAVTNEKPAFVLFGGDLANHPQPPVPPVWTNIMAPVYEAGIPIYPVMGNHDMWEVPGFVRTFGSFIPDNGPDGEIDRTYAIRHANALVIGMDAFVGTNTYRVNQTWLSAVLATNDLPHVFVFSHPPAFNVFHIDCLGQYPEARDAFWRSLEAAGCRVYFSGHDHFYDHARLDNGDGNPDNDVHQFVCGTAGSPFYPDSAYDGTNGVWNPVRLYHEANFGYAVVEIDGDQVTVNWRRRIEEGVFEPCPDIFSYTATPRLRMTLEGSDLHLRFPPGTILQSAPTASGPFTNVPTADSTYTVDPASQNSLFFRAYRPPPTGVR